MIRIVVDSTCDLPAGYAAAHGITVLPLHVTAEGKEYRDKVDITTIVSNDVWKNESNK